MKRDTGETTDKTETPVKPDEQPTGEPQTNIPERPEFHPDETNSPTEGDSTNPPEGTGEQTPPAVPEVPEHTPVEETPAPEENQKPEPTGADYEQKESGGFDAEAEREAAKPHIHSKKKNWDDGAGREWPRSR